MESTISSYPPLGQVTQLKDNTFQLYALLEVDNSYADEPWDVAVWYSSSGADWTEKLLSSISVDNSPLSLQPVTQSRTLLYFGVPFTVSSSLQFTLKFRNGHDQPWRWSRKVSGISDGIVLATPSSPSNRTNTSLSNVIRGLNPELTVTAAESQTPNTELWTISASVDPAEDDHSAYADVDLGTPWGGALRYFALVRHGLPWLGPRHGRKQFKLDKDAVMCSFLSHQGKHLVLLGVSGLANVTTLLRSSNSGSVTLHIRSDNESQSSGLVLASIGDDFESAMAAVMYHARTVIFATGNGKDKFAKEIQSLTSDIKPEWYENWYDGLGYCTWNALGQRLTEEKILHAVETLSNDHINISSLIIDDNWQDIDYQGQSQYQHGWKGFEAEPNAFPNGLKDTVSLIRSKHPSIQHVAVWHALLGYWGGISSSGNLAQTYKTVRIDRTDSNFSGPMTVIAKEDVGKFYNDFYRFLSDCGIDGVKTDVQYMVDTWVSAKHRRKLTETYLDSWMISTLRYFGIRAISCMSQAPQLLFLQQLPHNRPTMLARNSDDFYPDIPDSHPWHLFANAHNALLTQHLNILPDWDMFQTGHEFAGFHAAARCLSGGPIYITDTPGKHNAHLISEMTGPTPRGKTVIFRPSVVGKSIDAYTSYDEPVLLKIGSYHGRAITGTPLLGVFNTSRRAVSELIPLSRIPGVSEANLYVVRAHRSGLVTPVIEPGSTSSVLAVSLDVRKYEIFTAFPITQFDSETNGMIYFANLGLIGKITGAAAITTNQSELLHTGRVFLDTRLKALGVLGVYISSLPDMLIERDFMVTIQGQPIPPHTVTINKVDSHILNIDVETAWKEMGLTAGWSNEVEVKVYFDIEHL
ncbi:glycoside hydrolase family 36 protein [Daldinia caldariorum]|uniref:glycoside hydrolase family 36 protein n=1 Tax=Daldinia caldariorum TaxID=326644 RepID=UPI002007496A|nr:glycoside hydrolase family 36 protein [Daldinia caldariorum]KAI1465436.1 glycoside hydrolase family 36 protein [Daldinia caldariorum]